MKIYKCIKKIKYKKTIFNINDLAFIVSVNDNYYLLSDINYLKGLSILKEDFVFYFTKP